MKAYQADIAKFDATETQIFGISVDSVPANREFAKQIAVTFPLLSDFKRTVVRDYGIFNEEGAWLWYPGDVCNRQGREHPAHRRRKCGH